MNQNPVRAPEGAGATAEPEGRASSATRRLLPLVLPVWLLGGGAVGAAGWSFAASRPSIAVLGGVLALLAAAALAEAFPVPLESLPAGYVSLAATFVVGTAVIYGWAPATLIAFLTRVLLELYQRRPAIRLAYNGAMYALAGAATGLAVAFVPDHHEVAWLMLSVLVGATAFYSVNIFLVAAVIARWAAEPFPPLLARTAYWTSIPFGIMASVSLMLQVLWERSPLLAAALVGPLIAIVLYQRSVHRALAAMRLALTDPLTGLGNHRHFHERLQSDLDRAEDEGFSLSLCLLDLDDFKRVNDSFGHPAGDQLLAEVASCLRQGGEAFRLGGDEFALVLPSRDELEGLAIAQAVVARIAEVRSEGGETVSASAGVATYPAHGVERNELMRLADAALYRAKGEGKNRVHLHRPALRVVDADAAASGL
jgi:diguanylate cyclase (GGDEF)-like protein